MRILFYQPYNQIVVYIESIVEQFAREGHEMFFLSHAEKGETHKNLERFGCKTYSVVVQRKFPIKYYFDRIRLLVDFCRVNQIDIVYSHFQEANLIAVLAQYFCKSKFVITRHHSDCAFLDNNWKEKFGDKIINKLARVYIVPSPKVWKQTVEIEGTNARKVKLINYGYNFSSFQKVDSNRVNEIRNNYKAKVLLVKAARFIPEKRHTKLVTAIGQLIKRGYDVKLLLLGKGPLEVLIKNQIEAEDLSEHIFIEGFKLNVMDYFAAADLVVHFSLSEASNSAIKEAAITDTTVAVCNDVGDFDDYIIHGENGIILDRDNPGKSLIEAMDKIMVGEYNLSDLGKRLHQHVISKFDISNVIHIYKALNGELMP